MSTGQLLHEMAQLDAALMAKQQPLPPRGKQMARMSSQVQHLDIPPTAASPMKSQFSASSDRQLPFSTSAQHLMVPRTGQSSWPDPRSFRSYSPRDFVEAHSGFQPPSFNDMQLFGGDHGSYTMSPTNSFMNASQGSYNSSNYLATSSSLYSGETLATSFSEHTPLMSRQPSMAGTLCGDIGMLRMHSVASQAQSTGESELFHLDLDEKSPSSISVFDGLAQSQDVVEQTSASLVFMGTGMNYRQDIESGHLGDIDRLAPPAALYDSSQSSATLERSISQMSALSDQSLYSASAMVRQASERYHKHIDNASKSTIVPKVVPLETTAGDSSHKPNKKAISRVPSKRVKPTQKQHCKLCNKQPEGFHGTHELRRHIERAHRSERRAWICVDVSRSQSPGNILPQRPLDICKWCRQGKIYNVYYNAAAHIRRAHFNPRIKGRGDQLETQEKRAGNSGGTEPSIKWLQHHGWIKEVDIVDRDAVVASGSSKTPKVKRLTGVYNQRSTKHKTQDNSRADSGEHIEPAQHSGSMFSADWNWQLPGLDGLEPDAADNDVCEDDCEGDDDVFFGS